MTPRHKATYTVLVVDDDPSVLATYCRLLRRVGYRTVAEQNPRKVLDNGYADGKIDLLLLDYKMPGMDGLSLLAELRRRECQAHCILVSAYLNDDIRQQAKNLGVNRVMEKPVDCCTLRRALEELLPVAAGSPINVAG